MRNGTEESTGGIPAERNLNSNPNSNSAADPNEEQGQRFGARSWTVVCICLKFVGVGVLVFMAQQMSAGASSAREKLGSESEWKPGVENGLVAVEFVAAAINWSALPLIIFYCLVLLAAVKEKLCLIRFYVLWLLLEILVAAALIFLFRINLGAPFGAVLPFAVWFLFNWFAIHCAGQFIERVLRKSSPVESTPTAVSSV